MKQGIPLQKSRNSVPIDMFSVLCLAFLAGGGGVDVFDRHCAGAVQQTFRLEGHVVQTFLDREPLTRLQLQRLLEGKQFGWFSFLFWFYAVSTLFRLYYCSQFI